MVLERFDFLELGLLLSKRSEDLAPHLTSPPIPSPSPSPHTPLNPSDPPRLRVTPIRAGLGPVWR